MNPAAKRKKIVLDVKKAVIFALNVEAQIRKGILGSATILFYKKINFENKLNISFEALASTREFMEYSNKQDKNDVLFYLI